MANPIFSRYSQGENRVTATILAVFEKLSFALVERILQILSGEQNLGLMKFENQVKTSQSVPDARIQASFAYWIETKTKRDAISVSQLKNHLDALKREKNIERKILLLLSPDRECPKKVKQLHSKFLVWVSFDDLYTAIREVSKQDAWLESDLAMPTEQERFLMRELVQMLLAERLVMDNSDSVLVVAAKRAIKEYEAYSVYMCQPHRAFQPVARIAFYHDGMIDRHIAKVVGNPIESVILSHEGLRKDVGVDGVTKRKLGNLVDQLKKTKSDRYGTESKVIFLSSSDSSETMILATDVRNNLTNDSGRPQAFTQGQRYVSLLNLQKNPKTTKELLGLEND
jgi:hypothetical protein